ncbi:glycosyltransferase [Cellulomonas sp. C5510]|uniref:glycosyltransferase n=1 Tax=Cellulomonas sp. C5510 TaxID=2871170 RepID=UPI001C94B038|nr:glycosyltransferase [Cellulomonas sp. C5510]QZN84858.1 glycosyltransferase [Cellulomonas sp. C5510]
MSVGVTLCTYNGAAHVDAQVASLLRQRVPLDELIVADDGSTDGTLDRVRRHAAAAPAERRPALTVLEPAAERLGVRGNVERALAASTADVVLLADQDDVWHEDKVEAALTVLRDDPTAQVVGGNAVIWRPGTDDERGTTLFATLHVGERELATLGGPDAFAAAVRRNVVPGMTMAIRREFLALALPLPPSWTHDGWLVTLAAARGVLRVDPTPRVDYRMHGSNVVGVARRTSAYYLRRLTDSPRTARRNVARSEELLARLALAQEPGEDPRLADAVRLAGAKLAFERARAAYPATRALRLPAVARQLASARYARLSPNGAADALRDLTLRGTV